MNREKFILEEELRKNIREHYERVFPKTDYKTTAEESIVESYIRNIVKEARKSPVPFGSTGINILQDTLKKIIPIIHDDFFTLTSDLNQRKSFRAHIVNAFKNSLAPIRTYVDGTSDDTDIETTPDTPGVDVSVNEIDIGVGDQEGEPAADPNPDKDERFIDIEDPSMTKTEPIEEPSEEEKFVVPGEDPTGRNVALQSYKKIEKNITDAFQLLGMAKDRDQFYEYGLANLKLYFDRWEAEITPQAEDEPMADVPDAEQI